MSETTLYSKDNLGNLRMWRISCTYNLITICYGQMGGSMQYQTEYVHDGKASRSLEEQVESRMNSRISKQIDKGYVRTMDEAMIQKRTTNAMGYLKPMLAQPIAKVSNINYSNAIVQPKFDGNRCMIRCENGINIAYTRNGKALTTISHITNDLVLEEGTTVDGELYYHGAPLQSIVSWVKREQPFTKLLKYHLYDVASNLPYKERSNIIRTLPLGESISPVYGLPTSCKEDVYEAFRGYREQGYEGAILRWGDAGYEDGKRSKSLVKVKEWESEEFDVIDIIPSREGWGICVCALSNGKIFKVSAPGSIPEKYKILINKELHIGKKLTTEFANYTDDGIPFHPVAINFRDAIQ